MLAIAGAIVEWFIAEPGRRDRPRHLHVRRPVRPRRLRAAGHHADLRGLAVPASVDRARQRPPRHRRAPCCSSASACSATSSAGSPSRPTAPRRSPRGGGVLGWMLAWPFVAIGAAVAGRRRSPVVLLALSLFIITKTPPNRIGARLRELYAYLFGAELPEPRRAEGDGGRRRRDAVRLARATSASTRGRVVDAVVAPQHARAARTGVRHPGRRATSCTDASIRADADDADFDIDLLDELTRAEDAVKRFTGEVDPAPTARATTAAATLPGFRAATRRRRRASSTARRRRRRRRARPYRLPAASILAPGTPPKARTRRERRGRSRRSPSVLEPVPGRRAGHRLQPRPDGHALRGRARPRRQGRARHGARQEPLLRGRVERGQHPLADPGQERDRRRDPEQGPRDRLARRRAALGRRDARARTR